MPRRKPLPPMRARPPSEHAQAQRTAAQALDDELMARLGGEPQRPIEPLSKETEEERHEVYREMCGGHGVGTMSNSDLKEMRNRTQREAAWKKPLPADARPIPSFPGYGVTKDGRVFHGGSERKPRTVSSGKLQVQLETANGRTSRLIETLVRETWGDGSE